LRAIGLRVALVLGGLVAGLAVAELVAWIYDDVRPYLVNVRGPGEEQVIVYEPNSRLRWVLNPGHPEHSSLGLRGEEIDPAPAPGAERIAVVGDSVPYGIGVKREEAYPRILERRLREQGCAGLEVVNAGVPAYTGQQIGLFFLQRVVGLRPTRVIVSVTGNDLDSLPVIVRDGDEVRWEFYEDRYGPEMIAPPGGLSDDRGLALWRRSHLYRLLIRAMVQRRLGTEYGVGVEASADRNLAALISIHRRCRAEGVPVLYVLVPALLDGPDPIWTPRMERIALGLISAGCPLLDLRERLAPPGRALTGLRANPDDVWHLNAEGHRLIAVRVLAELQRLGWVTAASARGSGVASPPSFPSPSPSPSP